MFQAPTVPSAVLGGGCPEVGTMSRVGRARLGAQRHPRDLYPGCLECWGSD